MVRIESVSAESKRAREVLLWYANTSSRVVNPCSRLGCAGVNAIPQKTSGTIRVGDNVTVLATTDPENRDIGY